jgi:hypothetical protein
VIFIGKILKAVFGKRKYVLILVIIVSVEI